MPYYRAIAIAVAISIARIVFQLYISILFIQCFSKHQHQHKHKPFAHEKNLEEVFDKKQQHFFNWNETNSNLIEMHTSME